MRIIPATDKHIQWMEDKSRYVESYDSRGIAMESDSHEIMAVCMLDSWTKGAVQIHFATGSKVGLKHKLIKEVMNFVFNTADRSTIICVIGADNKKAMKIAMHVGFEALATIHDGQSKGVDSVMFQMRKDNCRWIKRNM